MTFPEFVTDPTLHPGALEIRDPITQEVLGGVVFDEGGQPHAASTETLVALRSAPQAIISLTDPGRPEEETPIYCEVAAELGMDPLGVLHALWLNPATGEARINDGSSWLRLALER